MPNQTGINNSNYRNGYSIGSRNTLYTKYFAMINRCYNENDKAFINYGGRGIKVHQLWIDNFESYIEYIKLLDNFGVKDYSIDRENNDGNYEPGNLRWINRNEQNANRRKRKDNTTGYVGVQLRKNGKYKSDIMVDKKRHHLGYFDNLSDAVNARNNFILKNDLEKLGFKIQNFPYEDAL